MKEIVVLSGKGGTGKTSIAASFAYLAGDTAVIADCDVDAADMHILMKPDYADVNDFYSGKIAHIDANKCMKCGSCIEHCHFNAISADFVVDEISCEGCGYCQRVCKYDAISLNDALVGQLFISSTEMSNKLVHARLGIGADNSGKLVARVKKEARNLAIVENAKYVIVDGSPGIGCPVVSSLTGADFVILITEPSVSGFHDLKRVYELVKGFKLKTACIINKYDINSSITIAIKDYLKEEDIIHLSSFPYCENFTKAMTEGKTIVEYDKSHVKVLIEDSWNEIKKLVK
jgi:MinD superfamily P-loop ATPase